MVVSGKVLACVTISEVRVILAITAVVIIDIVVRIFVGEAFWVPMLVAWDWCLIVSRSNVLDFSILNGWILHLV